MGSGMEVIWIQNFHFLFLSLLHYFSFSLFLSSLLLLYLSIPVLFWPVWVNWGGGGMDWTQNGHGGPHLLHILAGYGVFAAAMILAIAEFSVTEGTGWEVVISLAGGFWILKGLIFSLLAFLPELTWGYLLCYRTLAIIWRQINSLRQRKWRAMEL